MRIVAKNIILIALCVRVGVAQDIETEFMTQNESDSDLAVPTLNMYDGNDQLVFENEYGGYKHWLSYSTSYKLLSNEERFTENAVFYKHWRWDERDESHVLDYSFMTPAAGIYMTKTAQYRTAEQIDVYNNYEEWSDEGEFWLRDPWYVNGDGDQEDVFTIHDSPLIPPGCAEIGASGAVFLAGH